MSQSGLTKHERTFDQQESGVYTATLLDENDSAIALSDITSLTMSLFLASDPTDFINSRNDQNVLNANNCTYHATSGLFTWRIQSADNPIRGASLSHGAEEKHIAVIEVAYGTDGVIKHVIEIAVREVATV